MSVTIIGTVAYDSIRSPFGEHARILGGSATYASFAASLFAKPAVVSIIGDDFLDNDIALFNKKNIDITGLKKVAGKTFHWKGYYEGDMNQAFTEQTDLNVLLEFDPVIPEHLKQSRIVFLGNIHPALQLKALQQFAKPEVVILDTMNFWIENERDALLNVLPMVDILIVNDQEIRMLTESSNIIRGLEQVKKLGVKRVIVKKGEHGAIMYDGTHMFMCPAFPLPSLKDPTGAGDSFAGAISGYISQFDDITDNVYRKAMIKGTLVSAQTVQDFSLARLKSLKREDLHPAYHELKSMTEIPTLSI